MVRKASNAPTVTFGTAASDFTIRYTGGATTAATAISSGVQKADGCTISVTGTGTPLTAGQGCNLRLANDNAYIMIQCEL